MLILLAVILAAIAIWLAIQLFGRRAMIEWTPIATSPMSAADEVSDPTSLAERLREAAEREERAIVSVGTEAFDDLVSEVASKVQIPFAHLRPTGSDQAAQAFKSRKREREYDGRVTLPQKVYEGTSKTVSVIINFSRIRTRVSHGELLSITDEDGMTRFTAFVPEGEVGSQFFEVELLAAGIMVEGDKKQSKLIGNKEMAFHWNCAFPTKGDYEITLIVRLKTGKRTLDLGEPIKHRLRVVKYFGLPKQMIAVIIAASGLAGTLIGIVDGGHKLKWW